MSSSPPPAPTVYVVDDDEPVRQSLAALLDVLGFKVQTFSAPGSFHRFYRPHMPGCLLLDVRMPRQSGLELYEQLLVEGKRLPVIFITAHADVRTAVAAMKTGAIEFFEKPFEIHSLMESVQRAVQLDAEWRARDKQFAAIAERLAKLNASQRETLELIRAGETNKAIANRLAVTERAVEMRRATLMRKLQVRSVAELVDLVTTHRILAELHNSTARRLTNGTHCNAAHVR
jgi:FixJ family two-component response regulator